MISAPAGFGKTTLVSEWLSAKPRVAWLSLEQADGDIQRFFNYLIHTLQTLDSSLGQASLATLNTLQTANIEEILTSLINDLSTLSEDVFLVLDDYHVIGSDFVDEAVEFLLEHSPPQFHLVITSRTVPNLPLPRLRVRGQIIELNAGDLRFMPDEAAGFFNQVMGLNLSAEDISTLESRTEGWIAGLQLAAISLQKQADVAGFITSFSGGHQVTLDYLFEEVLQKQAKDVQTFLLQTSVLERFCAPLCDAVTNLVTSEETLDYLERVNLLLVPLDHERRWYRYHHLFADALRARLHKTHADLTAELHLRASIWLEQHSFTAEAIHHALKATAFERAAGLIESEWSVIRKPNFQSQPYLAWLRALPAEIIQQCPVLSLSYGWEMMNAGELDGVKTRLADAEAGFKSARAQDPIYLASVENARGYLALVNQTTTQAIHHAGRAIE